MVNKILADKAILKYFPELEPMFDIQVPKSNCSSCSANAYKRKCASKYKEIIRRTNIREGDLVKYFGGKYAEVKVTTRGIVNFANSLMKRTAATASGIDTLVSETDYLDRILKCRSCPKLENGICTICTCPIHEKAKLSTETCPHPHGPVWKTIR